jgi:hypothetical protein
MVLQVILGLGDEVRIGPEIVVTVVEIQQDRVRLGVTPPRRGPCWCEKRSDPRPVSRVVGEREFTDGVVRLVYEDDQGQYVLDADAEMVRGVWLLPPDDATIVEL